MVNSIVNIENNQSYDNKLFNSFNLIKLIDSNIPYGIAIINKDLKLIYKNNKIIDLFGN